MVREGRSWGVERAEIGSERAGGVRSKEVLVSVGKEGMW
jgi:hypothetical protein